MEIVFQKLQQISNYRDNTKILSKHDNCLNKAKYVKPFKLLSAAEITTMPIWGSDYFKINDRTLQLRNWIDCGIKYVKDILNENGEPMDENELMNNVHHHNL